ncbi:uncharacterized protein LOC106088812 [Stomoxys calcitrans]|uniref:uncharacterized protein LOC106088812 n=1 Tax=Stomoxys calcitrans TaxID=35570 RepID=UPI0027E3732D|nr:uncharacterized protein LOC106088812 [Stomoxys calcitrans]
MRQLEFEFGQAIIFGCLLLPMVIAVDMSEAKLKEVTEECMKQTNVSIEQANLIMKDDLEKISDEDFSHNMRCYLLCYHKQIGLFDANGPMRDAFIKFMEIRYPNKKDKVLPALRICKHQRDPDSCEQTYKFERCMAHTIEGEL